MASFDVLTTVATVCVIKATEWSISKMKKIVKQHAQGAGIIEQEKQDNN